MKISIPSPSLVVLIGASGAGKSTFARRHFLPTEILSSDTMRGWVSDDENSLEATTDAFAALHFLANMRLKNYRSVVVDATNVQFDARKPLVALAKANDLQAIAIVLDVPERVCQDRNAQRPDRNFGPHVVRNHIMALRRSMRGLQREGFRYVFRVPYDEIDTVEIVRENVWTNKSDVAGPFDIIGDVHGCLHELTDLVGELGYAVVDGKVQPRPDRKLVFVGDLVDRGPDSAGVLRFAMDAQQNAGAIIVPGNHDEKLLKKLRGKDVQLTHGLDLTWAQLEAETPEFRTEVRDFLDGLRSHYVLDGGKLVVAHAGMREEYAGRASGRVRSFALYGETTGETDEVGRPIRMDWARNYRGSAAVVYGHTPVRDAKWRNNTICIDTACVFGGSLTALRWPERETVSVPARETYYEGVAYREDEAMDDDPLEITRLIGRNRVQTAMQGFISIPDANAAAALETMSRFAADPRWLVYLPPTMSPCETSRRPDALEHPDEAFAYFKSSGVETVICEEKHMGSRAVVVLGRDEAAIQRRFGIEGQGIGMVVTRTGRPFFTDADLHRQFLERLVEGISATNFWESMQTDWAVLDAELLPWSFKADALLTAQYAPTGASAAVDLAASMDALRRARERGVEGLDDLANEVADRSRMIDRYRDAYRRYLWPVKGVDDLKLAPFHILATEGATHFDKNHHWHMDWADKFVGASQIFRKTERRVVQLEDEAQVADATEWWNVSTSAGMEGMVVKPIEFMARNEKGWIQPGVKCRGREYLRIIYGPEYDRPENIERLRSRSLGRKRSLAMREFALGREALERFVRGDTLDRVHECVFGVLALESEPVDPRL